MRKKMTLLALALLSVPIHAQESLTIGIVDFYGLRSINEDKVRATIITSNLDFSEWGNP